MFVRVSGIFVEEEQRKCKEEEYEGVRRELYKCESTTTLVPMMLLQMQRMQQCNLAIGS